MTEDSTERARLQNEIRFGERLAQRTARLYRHLQFLGALVTVVGLTAAAAGWGQQVPKPVVIAGGVLAALFGAWAFVMRAGDKAAIHEADAKRYSRLQAEQHANDAAAIRAAQLKAREGDPQEFEALRDIAWNDVMIETGNVDKVVPLTFLQRVLRALA